MSVEAWISEKRRKLCARCDRREACAEAGVIHSIFAPVTDCPLKLHKSRDDEIAARAWPDGAVLEECGC